MMFACQPYLGLCQLQVKKKTLIAWCRYLNFPHDQEFFFFISFFTVANDANDFSCSCVHSNCIMIIDTESRTRWEKLTVGQII